MIKKYGTSNQLKRHVFVEAPEVRLSYYPSLYYPESNLPISAFKSMINFFQDLFAVNQQMSSMKNVAPESKKSNLKILLHQINAQLPACVYVPFIKSTRLLT